MAPKKKNYTHFQLPVATTKDGIRYCSTRSGPTDFLRTFDNDITTMHEFYQRSGWKTNKDLPAVGRVRILTSSSNTRTIDKVSWGELLRLSSKFGKLLLTQNTALFEAHQRIGIYSPNCIEFVMTQVASALHNLTFVALYDTLGVESSLHILNQCQIKVLVVYECSMLAKKLVPIKHEIKDLAKVIIINQCDECLAVCQGAGWKCEFFDDILKTDIGMVHLPEPPSPQDIHSIQYTSGTTGAPKGVILTHENYIGAMASMKSLIATAEERIGLHLGPEDSLLNFLPMAHIYAQLVTLSGMLSHVPVYFPSVPGDPKHIFADAQFLNPTMFPLVPRVMNKVMSAVTNKLEKNIIQKQLFNFAMNKKLKMLDKGIITNSSLYDIVLKKFRNSFGNNVRFMMSAAAPAAEKTLRYFQAGIGVPVIEMFGQTELCGPATFAFDKRGGHIGVPFPSLCARLLDVPEMSYFRKNNRGELCFKGPSCTPGYFSNPNASAELFDEDGWLKTGDIAEFLENGNIKLIDRKKNLFKTAYGEYVSPENLENVYSTNHLVHQIFVTGDSTESYTVAVVVPEMDAVEHFAKQNNLKADDALRSKAFIHFLLFELRKTGKQAGLMTHEQVAHLYITTDLFTVQNGLLTPSSKNVRRKIAEHFRTEIYELYYEGSQIDTSEYKKLGSSS